MLLQEIVLITFLPPQTHITISPASHLSVLFASVILLGVILASANCLVPKSLPNSLDYLYGTITAIFKVAHSHGWFFQWAYWRLLIAEATYSLVRGMGCHCVVPGFLEVGCRNSRLVKDYVWTWHCPVFHWSKHSQSLHSFKRVER